MLNIKAVYLPMTHSAVYRAGNRGVWKDRKEGQPVPLEILVLDYALGSVSDLSA